MPPPGSPVAHAAPASSASGTGPPAAAAGWLAGSATLTDSANRFSRSSPGTRGRGAPDHSSATTRSSACERSASIAGSGSASTSRTWTPG